MIGVEGVEDAITTHQAHIVHRELGLLRRDERAR